MSLGWLTEQRSVLQIVWSILQELQTLVVQVEARVPSQVQLLQL